MKLVPLIFFLFWIHQIYSQNHTGNVEFYDTSNYGTVKTISNDEVCAIVFFVSGKDSDWSTSQKQSKLRKDKASFKALKRELERFDIDFKIHFEVFNLERDFEVDSVIDIYSLGNFKRSELQSLNKKNAEAVWEYYSNSDIEFFKNETYKTYKGGYFLIVHHLGSGKTNASPDFYFEAQPLNETPEYITIFDLDLNYKKHHRNTTVHEFLHLLGAFDLYKSAYFGYVGEDYIKLYNAFPKSVMRDQKDMVIDDFTAWRIGLNPVPDAWYLDMIPKVYLKSTHMSEQQNTE